MKIIHLILIVSLFLLIGTVLEQLFMFALGMEYSEFTVIQWIFQCIFWITLICFGVKATKSKV